MNQRQEPIRSSKILASAKGATCTARFDGICNGNPETTVWAHLNGAAFGKGMGVKAHDVLGFHACFDCHAYYDVGHGTSPVLDDLDLVERVLSAVCETYVRLIRAGLVVIPQDKPKAAHERPVPARKPKEQRGKITSQSNWPSGQKIPTRPMRGKANP